MEEQDPIVTLLDGTKIPKSAVPNDVIYINEKGLKVKKVLKPSVSEPTLIQRAGVKLTDAFKVVGQSMTTTASTIGNIVQESATNAKKTLSSVEDEIADLATMKIKSIIAGVKFEDTLAALDKYTKNTGKDVSVLRNFIVELQKFAQDDNKH